MIKKLITATLLLFVVGCSSDSYNQDKLKDISIIVNGIEIDNRKILDYEGYSSKSRIAILLNSKEEIYFTNYTLFFDKGKVYPRKIFITLTEPEFQEFLKVVARCE